MIATQIPDGESTRRPLIRLVSAGMVLPVSLNQERSLLAGEVARRSGAALSPPVIAVGLKIEGAVDYALVRLAIREIILRHAALRTKIFLSPAVSPQEQAGRLRSFAQTGLFEPGMFVQSLSSEDSVDVPVSDISHLSPEAQNERIRTQRDHLDQPPLDRAHPPHLRAAIFRLAANCHLLVVGFDHIVGDGWSGRVILRDFSTIYQELTEEKPISHAPRISFQDFTIWQHGLLPHLDESLRYWRLQWAEFGSYRVGFPDLPFALEANSPAVGLFTAVRVEFDSGEVRQIKEFIRKARVTLYMFFLTLYSSILRSFTGGARAAVWAHLSNRTQPELHDTVGFLANTHLLGICLV